MKNVQLMINRIKTSLNNAWTPRCPRESLRDLSLDRTAWGEPSTRTQICFTLASLCIQLVKTPCCFRESWWSSNLASKWNSNLDGSRSRTRLSDTIKTDGPRIAPCLNHSVLSPSMPFCDYKFSAQTWLRFIPPAQRKSPSISRSYWKKISYLSTWTLTMTFINSPWGRRMNVWVSHWPKKGTNFVSFRSHTLITIHHPSIRMYWFRNTWLLQACRHLKRYWEIP